VRPLGSYAGQAPICWRLRAALGSDLASDIATTRDALSSPNSVRTSCSDVSVSSIVSWSAAAARLTGSVMSSSLRGTWRGRRRWAPARRRSPASPAQPQARAQHHGCALFAPRSGIGALPRL